VGRRPSWLTLCALGVRQRTYLLHPGGLAEARTGPENGGPSEALALEKPMRYHTRSLSWRGETFRFERMPAKTATGNEPQWAVSRRGEFIGTMPCGPEVTTKEFDLRCLGWLRDLLGPVRR
jgi:hypothetical protein